MRGERRVMGEGGREREREHLHTEKLSDLNRIIKNKFLDHLLTVKSAAVNICMYVFWIEIRSNFKHTFVSVCRVRERKHTHIYTRTLLFVKRDAWCHSLLSS